jgi:hypothetical protein
VRKLHLQDALLDRRYGPSASPIFPVQRGILAFRDPQLIGESRLSGDDGLATRVQRLADAETACCSFFTFTVTSLDRAGIALGIEVPPARADVLTALLKRAER